MKAVKQALHVATVPSSVVCREVEQKKVIEFCKACIEQEKAGSIYVCGCPGTGKTLSINKVKEQLLSWSKEVGLQPLESLALNCTSLTNTSEIFSKILEKLNSSKKRKGRLTPLQHLQDLFCQRSSSNSGMMLLIIIDEMDYLITKDRAVLHDLFMLTTFPFSRFILIGIANAIDLADRFLQRLKSLNCEPFVVTFCAYSKDQIVEILQQRLMNLGCNVFEPLALEYCARKVAAASGDMRKVLDACRTAIEVLETELRDSSTKEQPNSVTFDHMDVALSKAFKSPKVDIIKSLPQHQQIILCSMVKLFRGSKKNATTIGELNKSYLETCKTVHVPAVGSLEFTEMCRVLSDQGLIKLGQSKQDRLKRVTLQIDILDISFAFKDIRFFKNCLEDY
ncbi:cell division control protein 6 homolog isoform X1 [Dendrobium catenatum]|uniref:Cell division control protein n=1 Tax=Dendrobium catenatum TaxID=906689 RepID=A0A2I0W751_9ASPA|nr:cell division control protein 6 homolog isoform X1 [Dendrobium catenatum]XP_020695298.1 cell division control protein 6 homolog isoform X1 [Dendrobium catenatum]PKU71486.1 hypothetical protein MA16_Dca004328 [Dendrobium catenatum]